MYVPIVARGYAYGETTYVDTLVMKRGAFRAMDSYDFGKPPALF